MGTVIYPVCGVCDCIKTRQFRDYEKKSVNKILL